MAPRKKVFNYMDNPENSVKATPSLKNASVIKDDEDGRRIKADYSLGKIVNGEITLIEEEKVQNKLIKFRIEGDIQGYVKWIFEDADQGGTIFSYKSSYEVKNIRAPSFLVEKVASRIDENNMKSFIQNLRNELE